MYGCLRIQYQTVCMVGMEGGKYICERRVAGLMYVIGNDVMGGGAWSCTYVIGTVERGRERKGRAHARNREGGVAGFIGFTEEPELQKHTTSILWPFT